jgi:hypothetical protein
MPVVQPPPWVALVVDMEGLQDHNAHLIRQPNHASLDVFDMPYRTAHLLQLIRHIQVACFSGKSGLGCGYQALVLRVSP